jgi:integrase
MSVFQHYDKDAGKTKEGSGMGSLTDKAIKAAKAKDKQVKLSDGEGLYLVVPLAGNRWWRFDYRFQGKQRTLSLGIYGSEDEGLTTLAQARDKAVDLRRLVRQGLDPSISHKVARKGGVEKVIAEAIEVAAVMGACVTASRPFGEIADEWLTTRVPSEYAGKRFDYVCQESKTFARDARMVGYLKDGKGIASGFGKVGIAEADYGDHLLPLLKACNHPTRIRLLSAARKITAFARVHKYLPKDCAMPFEGINLSEGFASHKVTHRPAIVEPGKFGELLRKIDGFQGRVDNLTWYALKLLALTFVRPGTVTAARWAHFNLRTAMWVVPFDELKMATEREEAGKSADDYVVPLSRQAVELLRELQKITGDGEYLFPNTGGSATMSENTMNFALHALGYEGIHCAHGFRASASTMLNRERTKEGRRRFERELIEIQQDRLDASTRAVYDRDDLMPERIELMQYWADKLDQMRGTNVVSFTASA